MEQAGYKVVVPDSKWDPAKQSTDVDDMVAQKVDLICLVPVDPLAIIPALKKAKESGVPVMTINTEADKSANQYIVGFSGVGCYEQGLVAAELLLDAMKAKGNIAVVEGGIGIQRLRAVRQGPGRHHQAEEGRHQDPGRTAQQLVAGGGHQGHRGLHHPLQEHGRHLTPTTIISPGV